MKKWTKLFTEEKYKLGHPNKRKSNPDRTVLQRSLQKVPVTRRVWMVMQTGALRFKGTRTDGRNVQTDGILETF